MQKSLNSRRSILNTVDQQTIGMVSPAEELTGTDYISTLRPPTIRQRKRQWEQKFRAKTYRGVSPQVHSAVKEAAADQHCSIDQAATAFLEYSLFCYRRGDLDLSLEPALQRGRWTLFPNSDPDGKASRKRRVWSERIWNLKPPKQKEDSKKSQSMTALVKPWKDWPWVGYRMPDAVVQAINELHTDKMVPMGEVVTRLLDHASRAYRAGRLVLTPDEPAQETSRVKSR